MTKKEYDYRRSAAEIVQLAHLASETEDKDRLLRLAERWISLAQRTRTAKRKSPSRMKLHPLVEKKFRVRIPPATQVRDKASLVVTM